jgi:hypothetical protein
LGFVSLLAHLVNIGVNTVSMPFLWLLIMPSRWPFRGSFVEQAKLAWQIPRRRFRNARRHLGAYLIIQNVRKKLAHFNYRLGAAIRRKDDD